MYMKIQLPQFNHDIWFDLASWLLVCYSKTSFLITCVTQIIYVSVQNLDYKDKEINWYSEAAKPKVSRSLSRN